MPSQLLLAQRVAAGDNQLAVARAIDLFGRLDTFIGNAGMFDYGARLVDTPIDALDRAFDEVFALNVKACLLGVKAAAPASAAVPLAFLPRPEDYTGHYVQLASRANAAATTGIVIACDGGLDVRGLGPPPSRDSE